MCIAEFDDADAKLSKANTQQIVAYGIAGVGAASLVAGVIVLLTADDPHKYDTAPAWAKRVVPLAAFQPGGATLGVSGSF